jgi:hypothetical protein
VSVCQCVSVSVCQCVIFILRVTAIFETGQAAHGRNSRPIESNEAIGTAAALMVMLTITIGSFVKTKKWINVKNFESFVEIDLNENQSVHLKENYQEQLGRRKQTKAQSTMLVTDLLGVKAKVTQ